MYIYVHAYNVFHTSQALLRGPTGLKRCKEMPAYVLVYAVLLSFVGDRGRPPKIMGF